MILLNAVIRPPTVTEKNRNNNMPERHNIFKCFHYLKKLEKKSTKKNNQRTNIKPSLAQKDGPPIGPIIVTAEKKDTGSETTRTA